MAKRARSMVKQVKAESGQGKAADSAKSSINRIKKALILLSISGLIALLPCLTVSFRYCAFIFCLSDTAKT